MRSSSVFGFAGLLASIALVGAGCRRDEIRTYTVAKEPVASSPGATNASAGSSPSPAMPGVADATMANTPVDTASGPSLAWDLPTGWTQGPERPMRKATLLIPGDQGGAGAELAVTAFPGDVGGNLANVNRWRQQLSLAPISQAELGGVLQHIDVGALHIDVVELVGSATPPATQQRVLGAIVPYSGATWFFKLTGPDAVVTREKDKFLAFVRSVRPAG